MGTSDRRSRGGVAWLGLMFLPLVVVVAGLVALFVWQGSKGGIRPKWRKPAVIPTHSTPTGATNRVPVPEVKRAEQG